MAKKKRAATIVPATPPAPKRHSWSPEGTVLGVALALRLLIFYQLRLSILFNNPYGDAQWFDQWAQEIAAGHWLGKGVFYLEPLYPYVLGVFYKTVGHHIEAIRFLQHIIGAVSCVLLVRIGTRIFNARVGFLAGLMAAGYGLLIFYEAQLLKETLAIFLMGALVLLLLRAREKAGWAGWLGSGFLAGSVVLLRGNFYLYLPLLTVWILWVNRQPEMPIWSGWKKGLLFVIGIALILFPVTLRNRIIGHDWVLSTYQGGTNFFMGNNPQATGIYMALRESREGPPLEEEDAIHLAEEGARRSLKPSEVSRYWFRQGLGFIMHHPVQFMKLIGVRSLLLFNAQEVPDYLDIQEVSRRYLLMNLPGLNFSCIGPLGLLGLVLVLRLRRKDPGAMLLVLYVAGAAISAMLFYVFARYRLVLIPTLILLAAYTLDWLWTTIQTKRWNQTIGGLVGLTATAILVNVSWVHPFTPGISHQTMGDLYLKKGQYDEAAAEFRRAIAASPGQPDPRLRLAHSLVLMKRYDEAFQTYEMIEHSLALQSNPAYQDLLFEARTQLVEGYLYRKNLAKARETLSTAAAMGISDFTSLVTLATAYKHAGMPMESENLFRKAMALQPDNIILLNNLANLLRDRGHWDEARTLYNRALAIEPRNIILQKNKAILEQKRHP